MLGCPDLIDEIVKQVAVINKRMKEAQGRKKSYVDLHKGIVEFEVREHVFVKILLIRGVMRFNKSSKLSLKYVGPLDILKRVGEVA